MKSATVAMLLGSFLAGATAAGAQGLERKGYSIFRDTLVDLTWPEVKQAAEEKRLVLLPLGVIEEHGPHMSLGPDAYLSYFRCVALKRQLAARHVEAVIAPPVYWGIMAAGETGAYPGSFTVSPVTMKALLGDVFADLKNWGFERVFVVNRHGDRTHRKVLFDAIAEAKERLGLTFYNDRERADAEANGPELKLPAGVKLFMPDFHAGAPETADMAAFFPEEVDLKTAASLKPEATFHPLGYVGDPASSRRLDARAFFEAEVGFLADCIVKWLREPGQPAARAGS